MRRAWAVVALLCAATTEGAPPPRIVTLAPHLAEIVHAAGAGSTLVGVSEYSDHPAAVRSLPRIGDGWQVDYERVLALRPDVVLAWESGTPAATIERLRALGLEVVVVPTHRLDDVAAALRRVGDLAGTRPAAEAAARRYEAKIDSARERHAGARPVTVFVEIDDRPLFTVGGRHVITEAVELCGGRNVYAGLAQAAPQVDVESVLAHDPEVILSTDDTVADPRAEWQRWTRLTAVRAGTVYSVPSDTVTRATPRLVDGVEAICAALDDARAKLERVRPEGDAAQRR
jgi:iron complex transport system substrate-binding protein